VAARNKCLMEHCEGMPQQQGLVHLTITTNHAQSSAEAQEQLWTLTTGCSPPLPDHPDAGRT
jgi:hypothetical protein